MVVDDGILSTVKSFSNGGGEAELRTFAIDCFGPKVVFGE